MSMFHNSITYLRNEDCEQHESFQCAEKKEVTPFILITAVIDTPLESLQLSGLV